MLLILPVGWAGAQPEADTPDPTRSTADPGWIPIRHASRPATLADGLFRLDFFASGALVDREDPIFELSAGTGYGISDDFEVGLVIVGAQISPAEDTGLLDPSGYLRYRLGAGALQAAAEARIVVPTSGRFGFGASVPVQVSFGGTARLDLEPSIEGIQRPDWVGVWDVATTLSVQLTERVRIYAGGRINDGVSGPVEPVIQPRGGVVFTFADGQHPVGDLELELQGPGERLGHDRPVFRGPGTDWLIVIAYRPFIRLPTTRYADPFNDPEFQSWPTEEIR